MTEQELLPGIDLTEVFQQLSQHIQELTEETERWRKKKEKRERKLAKVRRKRKRLEEESARLDKQISDAEKHVKAVSKAAKRLMKQLKSSLAESDKHADEDDRVLDSNRLNGMTQQAPKTPKTTGNKEKQAEGSEDTENVPDSRRKRRKKSEKDVDVSAADGETRQPASQKKKKKKGNIEDDIPVDVDIKQEKTKRKRKDSDAETIEAEHTPQLEDDYVTEDDENDSLDMALKAHLEKATNPKKEVSSKVSSSQTRPRASSSACAASPVKTEDFKPVLKGFIEVNGSKIPYFESADDDGEGKIESAGAVSSRPSSSSASHAKVQGTSSVRSVSSAGLEPRQYFGVTLASGKYIAHILVNGKRQYLGEFDTDEEAARAYDAAAIENHGVNARLNFPDEVESEGRKYRGVFESNQKFYARIWVNRKSINLGVFTNAKEAAKAYDDAARRFHGRRAVTNF